MLNACNKCDYASLILIMCSIVFMYCFESYDLSYNELFGYMVVNNERIHFWIIVTRPLTYHMRH